MALILASLCCVSLRQPSQQDVCLGVNTENHRITWMCVTKKYQRNSLDVIEIWQFSRFVLNKWIFISTCLSAAAEPDQTQSLILLLLDTHFLLCSFSTVSSESWLSKTVLCHCSVTKAWGVGRGWDATEYTCVFAEELRPSLPMTVQLFLLQPLMKTVCIQLCV